MKIQIINDLFLRPQQRKTIETEIVVPEKFTGIVLPKKYLLAKEGLLVIGGIFNENETISVDIMNLNPQSDNAVASFSGSKNIYLKKNDEIASVLYMPFIV